MPARRACPAPAAGSCGPVPNDRLRYMLIGYARVSKLGDTWHLDEVFVTIQGQRRYLWRAVDQDGDVLDILVQPRRDCRAAKHFFRKLLKGQESKPVRLITDKLSSYRAAHRAVMPSVAHSTDRYENTCRSLSPAHAATRATNATVQISRSGTTILVRARTRPQRWANVLTNT